MTVETIRGTAKEKIMVVACNLFYTQGYNATGIQQIIDEAGVSKGTFYTHFKTKDELGLAYLKRRHTEEMNHLKQAMNRYKDPHEKYIQFNNVMKLWMIETNYRGCAFANMIAEIPDPASPTKREAKYHYEAFRAFIRDIVDNLLASNPVYEKLDSESVANDYLLIQIGALTNAEVYQDAWPYDHAKKSIKHIIGEE